MYLLAMLHGLWALHSLTRDWTRATAAKAQNHNHYVIRKLPGISDLLKAFFRIFKKKKNIYNFFEKGKTKAIEIHRPKLSWGFKWENLWASVATLIAIKYVVLMKSVYEEHFPIASANA